MVCMSLRLPSSSGLADQDRQVRVRVLEVSHTPAAYHLEDFFLFESDGDKADFSRPITYAAFVD